MEDVRARFPGATFFDNVSGNAGRAAAVEQVYDELGRNGLVWVDGHLGNMAFAEVGGRVQAIIVDQDMIFRSNEWSSLNFIQRNSANLGTAQRLIRLFDDPLGTQLRYPGSLDAVETMKSLYRARYILMKQ